MAEQQKKELTHADVAKMVAREVPKFDQGGKKVGTEKVAIRADEVLSFKEYDTHVVVVTKDGQKFRGEKK